MLQSNEITSSCKNYKYEECLSKGWHFENEDHKKALEYLTKAKNDITNNKLVSSFENIVKARDIMEENRTLSSKMRKNIYSGSALRPRQKIYKTKIKNIYDVKSTELNVSSRNTALPLLIVECSLNESKIHLYNINKSLKDNTKMDNMDLDDIEVVINGNDYKMDKIKSGEKGSIKTKLNKCKNLTTSLKAINSLFDEKSIAKVELFKKGYEK